MDRATQLALNAINQRFYAAIAHEWSDTRKHPWPGFERVLGRLPEQARRNLRALDVGCGDGRFAEVLSKGAPPARYVGCDASSALLAHARSRGLTSQFEFLETDFVRDDTEAALPGGAFDLICVFGVLHHVPGRRKRQELVRALSARLAPAGILALTIWRLDHDERFASRVVAFADYNLTAAQPIAIDQLEQGDTLLRWGTAANTPRYCHFPDEPETQQLLAASGLRIVERFHADGRGGRLNEYALLSH